MKPAIKPILELEDLTMAKALLGQIGGPDPACSQRCVAFGDKYATWNPS